MLDVAQKLYEKIPQADYIRHPHVKLLARLAKATLEIIPQNPHRNDYLLTGNLSKFRRYKSGLQRHRLLFCFSDKPHLILYLYINDAEHLRKDGDTNDPYHEFEALVKKGIFSHRPDDPKIRTWIRASLKKDTAQKD